MTLPLIIVPDCNVLVHGRSLFDLPWEEFGSDSIEVRIVGQVVSELDSLKNRPGRTSRTARDISSQFRALLGAVDRTDVIRTANPHVTRRLWLGKQEARTPVREGLDLTHGDQAIINQVLSMADAGREVLLLTDDVLAAAIAGDFGARFKLLPEEWRRPAEQDETQKEIARLKTDNARLRAAEPKFGGWFTTNEGERIDRIEATVPRYPPLEPHVIETLMVRVEKAAPMAKLTRPVTKPSTGPVDLATLGAEFEDGIRSLSAKQISDYEDDYVTWLSKVRTHLEELHVIRTRRREWPNLLFVAENDGIRPAEQTLVELCATGGFYIQNPAPRTKVGAKVDDANLHSEVHLTMPPRVPAPARLDSLLSALGRSALFPAVQPFVADLGLPKARDANTFYWRAGREGQVDRMALECASWRHKREPETFGFRLSGLDDAPLKGAVVATVSAANVSTPLAQTLPVRLTFEERSLEEDAERMVSEFERKILRIKK